MRHLTAIAGLLALGSATGAVAAKTADGAEVTIDVKAKIAERCGISPKGSTNSPTMLSPEEATQFAFRFNIDCNTPFRIGAYSHNGAMRLTSAKADGALAQDGFSQEKAYRVKLDVGTDGAPIETEYCGSRSLANAASDCDFYSRTAGKGLGSGERTAIQKEGSLTVRWNDADSSEPRLAAGTYQDFITIVVGVKS